MALAAGWRTHRIARLVQVYGALVCAEFVHSFARVITDLLALHRNDPQSRVGELFGARKVRYFIVLVVGQQELLLHPVDLRRRIRFYMALEVRGIVECLAHLWSRNSDDWREFNFQIHISSVTSAHPVVGETIVCATILLVDRFDL
jgi:hypothetical protein